MQTVDDALVVRGGRSDAGTGFTARVAGAVLAISPEAITPEIRERIRHALLDWIGVTIAGAHEPSAEIMRSVLLAEAGPPRSHVVGTTDVLAASQAALANGVAGHALDFDDNMASIAHASVPVLSAVFALADEIGAAGPEVVRAMLAGYQGMVLIGLASSTSSYFRGFHSTGTFGVFGAACGCAALLQLDALALQRALGLAATQAAGLKASFGTMGKHLNAARAAADGLLAARLASAGFTGATDAIESSQGFARAHNESPDDFDPQRPELVLGSRLGVELLHFKTHASCAGTHSAIEAIRSLRVDHPFAVDDIDRVELVVSETLPDVCGIVEPASGMEGKFSIKHAASLALVGGDTGPMGFTDERVSDPELTALRHRVEIVTVARLQVASPTEVTIVFKGGESLSAAVRANTPVPDAALPDQWLRLVSKFQGLVAPVLGESGSRRLIELVEGFESLDDAGSLLEATAP